MNSASLYRVEVRCAFAQWAYLVEVALGDKTKERGLFWALKTKAVIAAYCRKKGRQTASLTIIADLAEHPA